MVDGPETFLKLVPWRSNMAIIEVRLPARISKGHGLISGILKLQKKNDRVGSLDHGISLIFQTFKSLKV